jgi:hypothetical protein
MGAAQARQRPRRTRNERIGMLSYQVMAAPHPGHAEAGLHTLRRSGTRAMTTFRKLPIRRPAMMKARIMSVLVSNPKRARGAG